MFRDEKDDDSSTDKGSEAVNQGIEVVEGEIVSDEEDLEIEETKEKIIYYVTDELLQSQYINMFRQAKMDAVILKDNIDQPFIQQLESKNETIKFNRIDTDLTDSLKAKTSKKSQKELEDLSVELTQQLKKSLKKEDIKVVVDKLKNKKIASVLTVSEQSRRMQDMMKMYSAPGMDLGMFGKDGQTLVLNSTHPLVQYVLENKEGQNVNLIFEQLYDLARVQNGPLSAEEMTKFVQRSNDILMILAKTE